MTQTPAAASQSAPESRGAISVSEAYQEIIAISRKARSQADYLRQILPVIVESLQSPFAMLYARLPSEVLEEDIHRGPTDPQFWKSLVRESLDETLATPESHFRLYAGKSEANRLTLAVLAVPLQTAEGSSIGALAMIVSAKDHADSRLKLSILESLAALAANCSDLHETDSGRQQTLSADAARAVAKVAQYGSRQELAFSLTNNLRNRTGSDQVVMGLVQNNRVRILCVSGQDEVELRSPEIARVKEAMEECLDMNQTLICQRKSGNTDSDTAGLGGGHCLHRQWHGSAGGAAVASIPLKVVETCMAIVSLRRDAAQPFTQNELDKVRELVEPYIGAVSLLDRAARPLVRHAWDACWETATALIRPSGWYKKAIIATLCLFGCWFCFGKMTYRVSLPAVIQPAEVRHLAAPHEARLLSNFVVQGDYVKAGQELCRFDQQELLIQKRQFQAEIEIAAVEEKQALAQGAEVSAKLARAKKDLLEARLANTAHKLEQMVVTAPFDGWVVKGDLRLRAGEILPMGEPLFEIAGSHAWRLELEVPEHLVADIKVGQNGRFATAARPEYSHDLTLGRVDPQTQLRKNRNIFVAEADIQLDDPWIKAGMEGVAKVSVDRRPVWWVTTHKLIDWVRLRLWM